ncbi:hypothetical protein JS82_07710 [Methanomassiliicoccaceae archaeon DOK]|nr:hypothetical protein JS82_07710 [Methanomassiliicoccaceae archaeon DOK]
MAEGKGKVTDSDGKRTKQVMVRFPKYTVERIDDYAGDTHSSRPDFVIDSVRQYIPHIVREAATVITEIEAVDVSRQAKDMFFIERMGERMFPETESYRKSKEGSPKGQDISVLVSFPTGLNDRILRTVESTNLFSSNQELIKTAVHWMLNHMGDVENGLEVVSEFQSTRDNGKALEKELERIRKELGNVNRVLFGPFSSSR